MSIVWYDPMADSESSSRKLALFNDHSNIQVFKEWQKVVDYIQPNTFSSQVLISGKDGEHLKLDFPSFASVFDDKDVSHVNKLHVYLRGLSVFLKRDQAKQDFVSAASLIYRDRQNIDEFQQDYNKYDMNTILSWYTRESFLYKMVNNCLRIATSDSILYSRLVIRDLETAIKDRFRQEKSHFSGLLYRGAYLSEQEWESLSKNVGKDVEMYGFLSTSKRKDVALDFLRRDVLKKALITVIVPAAPDLEEQGFADVDDLSKYNEQEVLFNIRSRFTVVEATTEPIDSQTGSCHHLVLLYGAVSMRKYVANNTPCVEISIKNGAGISCRNCSLDIHSINESSLLLKDLEKPDEYLCMKCLCGLETAKASSYLCLPRTNLQANVHKKLKGMLMPYKEDLDIRFYGLKCSGGCSSDKKRHQFSCIECREMRRV